MVKFIFLFLMVSLLASCLKVENKKATNELIVPLLSECENSVKIFLIKINIDFEVIKSDIVLKSHPSISGFIRLKSKFESKQELQYISNTFMADCYPISQLIIKRNDPKNLLKVLDDYEEVGLGPSYIVKSGENLKVYSKEYNKSRKRISHEIRD